jgi:hypothetical protein
MNSQIEGSEKDGLRRGWTELSAKESAQLLKPEKEGVTMLRQTNPELSITEAELITEDTQ